MSKSSSFKQEAIFENIIRKLLRKCNSEFYAQNVKFIVRQIREKHLDAKFALKTIKETFHDPNHNVGRFSHVVLNTCVEHCGLAMNDTATRNEYLKELKTNVLRCPHHDIKIQALITLRKWEQRYGQFSIFKKGERYGTVAGDDGVGGVFVAAKKRVERKKRRARYGSMRRANTPYQLYMKIRTQMLNGAKKGLHMKKSKKQKETSKSWIR